MKIRGFSSSICLAGLVCLLPALSFGQADPTRTVVRIVATQSIAEETSAPLRRLNLVGEFTISRQGPTNNALGIYIEYSGSATYGVDYPSLPRFISMAAGSTSAVIRVEAKPDDLHEPIETLVATLANCPPGPILSPCFDFLISPPNGSATIFLRDDGITEASLDITRPRNGDVFKPDQTIAISAVAIDLNDYISHVDFFDGDRKIGESQIYFIVAPPPGSPIEHHFSWTNASVGAHTLAARARLSSGAAVASPPVRIEVKSDTTAPPVVRIDATQPIAEEDSAPLDRLPLVGEFTLSRTGPTDAPQSVFLRIGGTATSGKDYQALPFLVSIPAGRSSVALRVEAIPDDELEGIETVIARLSNCPPDTNPPLGLPCYLFEIDPAHAEATVFVRDTSEPRATLTITEPKDGARFERGETISIEAIAIALDGYIAEVAFFDGDRKIGESRIDFIRAPDPGTPILHQFYWRDASVGPHVLTARALTPAGSAVSSAPVRITVGAESNLPPAITIVRPHSGETFPAQLPITIAAEAHDPDGYVPRAEFLVDGRKIGEVTRQFLVPPPPGQTQSFEFVWRTPEPGTHRLAVRATDARGATGLSAPVEIIVAGDSPLPVVTVAARDGFASEPGPATDLNTGSFVIRRYGPTNSSLAVKFSTAGTAENGVDYERIADSVTIPAGQRSATVIIRPLADDIAEQFESVRLHLEPSSSAENSYFVGRPADALVIISDEPWNRFIVAKPCQRLDDRCVLLAFAAEAGFSYRLEASDDLLNWETLAIQSALDPAVLFTDEGSIAYPRRFYRIAPEATMPGD